MKAYANYTDLELIESISNDDRQAFAELYGRYHQGIYNFLLTITRIPELAEDIMQDVFVKIWESRSDINIQSSTSAYLYRIGRNRAIDFMRRASLEQNIQDEIKHRVASGIDKLTQNDYEWQHYKQLYNQALESLPPQRRKAFMLVRQEGRSYEEAAEIMGISRNTLKQHLVLAVQSIRESLKENGDIVIILALILKGL